MGIVTAVMVPHPPLIVPEVGRGGEREIRKTTEAYREAARTIAEHQPDTILVLSPHQTMYADYFHISPGAGAKGDFAAFHAPQVRIEAEYDRELVDLISREAQRVGIPAGTLGARSGELDHGTMVPLYFVEQYWTDYRLVRIGLSGLPLLTHYEFGRCIGRTARESGRRVALIASGDLSHKLKEDGPYGYVAEGPEYDQKIMDVMSRAEFGRLFDFAEEFCERAGECGHRSFTILAGALDQVRVAPKMLSYEGVTGVGYGVCVYEPLGEDAERNFGERQRGKEALWMKEHREKEGAYVRFARSVIESYVERRKIPQIPEGLPEELYTTRAAAFVSIKKDGRLRGCIGTVLPARNSLAEEIRENAVSAATRDPRFDPITPDELEKLVVTVDVLSEPEEISSPEQLDVARYGVIVKNGNRLGLLLPDLEGVDSVEEQIRIAKKKAGIGEDEAVQLSRFEVIRHY